MGENKGEEWSKLCYSVCFYLAPSVSVAALNNVSLIFFYVARHVHPRFRGHRAKISCYMCWFEVRSGMEYKSRL